jgi:hypothetical protein
MKTESPPLSSPGHLQTKLSYRWNRQASKEPKFCLKFFRNGVVQRQDKNRCLPQGKPRSAGRHKNSLDLCTLALTQGA